MAHLSTHVLDTSRGVPAEGVAIELHRLSDEGRALVASTSTGPDGRTAAPLMTDTSEVAEYELTFRVADYFRRHGVPLTTPPFLDAITIRVGIADPRGRYHVPLLVSPYGYSTYRGS